MTTETETTETTTRNDDALESVRHLLSDEGRETSRRVERLSAFG